jgi:hypothetical protein
MTTVSRHAHPDIQALNDAIDAGLVASKDMKFATSLLDQFNSKGRLSSGQMHWVKKLGQAPVTRPHPKVDKLRTVVDSLEGRDISFGNDLISKWDRYGKISSKQLYWVEKLTEKGEAATPDEANKQDGWEAVVELFDQFEGSENGRPLKRPAITLVVEADTQPAPVPQVPRWGTKGVETFNPYQRELVVRPTKTTLKTTSVDVNGTVTAHLDDTHFLTITEAERAYSQESKRYLQQGKAVKRGTVLRGMGTMTPTLNLPVDVQIVLESLKIDPIATVRRLGRKTGFCCFCGLPLSTPESLTHGYGATCAKNGKLPHGKKSAKAIEVEMENAVTRMVMLLEGGQWAVVDLDTNEVIMTFDDEDLARSALDEWSELKLQTTSGDLV